MRATDALMILPPDFTAPQMHRALRLPPLGPAVVAACVEGLGLRFRAVDLVLECERAPLASDSAPLDDVASVEAFLRGEPEPSVEAAVDEIIRRVEGGAGRSELVAISVDRGSQVLVAAALSFELKRRWGARVIVGGIEIPSLRELLERTGARGADIVTTASTPAQIARAFQVLMELPADRRDAPIETNQELVPLVRGGMRAAPSAVGWPLPDFSIYELAGYRRDPLRAQGVVREGAPSLGPSLALPYYFSFECQFSCAFCQTGGTQEAKPADDVVRELATLAERWDVGEFVFFDTQINLHAEGLSRALLEARLDLRWSDSFRVRPLGPGLLELMARAGCASITVGVESASDRVLKAMVKGHRPEHASEMVRAAHACEMLMRINILTCFPGETREDLVETCDWVGEHAFAIDDLAPSSFYLTADSPVGRRPERFGIRVRGPREFHGENRFRKNPASLSYDEIDGYAWEEREPMLDESEHLVRSAWIEGRRGVGYEGPLSPSTMLALRRRFATKREIFELLGHDERGASVGDEAVPSNVSLAAALITPRRVHATVERAFALAFEEALPSLARRLVPGATAHALLFPDGSAFFFRGAVVRGARERTLAIRLEEALAEPRGPAALDARADVLRAGTHLDAGRIGAALGRVAVLTFRVERAADGDRVVAAPAATRPHYDGRTVFLREGELGLHVARALPGAGSVEAAMHAVLEREAARGPIGHVMVYFESRCRQACEFCAEPERRERTFGRVGDRALRVQHALGADLVSTGAFAALVAWMNARPEPMLLHVTGHDWLVHPHRDRLLTTLEQSPGVPVRLQGPSVELADRALARRVANLPALEAVATTLQSIEPGEHDAMVGRPGAHAGLIAALDALEDEGAPLLLSVVLTRRALATLPRTIAWMKEHRRTAQLQAFIPEADMRGGDAAIAPVDEVREALGRVAPADHDAIGSSAGVPLCAMPAWLRPKAEAPAIRNETTRFLGPCEDCAARTACPGVPERYVRIHGTRGLEAIR